MSIFVSKPIVMTDINQIAKEIKANSRCLPVNKVELEDALDALIHKVLFPTFDRTEEEVEQELIRFRKTLSKNLLAILDTERAENILNSFLTKLPEIHTNLLAEAKVFFKNDPAANSTEEVIITYPGFFALTVYRLSHELYNLSTPIIPRLFSEHAHSKVGIDINPGATIGHSFYIDHGTGIVIGESTIIGNNVKIYQGVTLGALFVTKELSMQKRHPTIEDNVVIYAGATILGGDTVVGHDSIIGGNAWLTKSVVPYSQVIQNAEIKIRNSQNSNSADHYMI